MRVGLSEFREAELQRSRTTTELIQLTNQPKPVVVVVVGGTSDAHTAASGSSAIREVEPPRPTPQNTGRAGIRARWILCGRLLVVILSEVIVAPLKNIAVHVVSPKCDRIF